ncbi:hypothetical protein A2V49_03820 [candidate division WWE3 bacterium RBG_19FT_COMBO_34_6]|uniref:Uncharacterized protein n=1 Tax=candidate division WWE3 bacterium RBG_19FT_COMBO_34_6 TaxID=1802612 RepID=A0A1F4UN29_UNCKA|nr:MAG: hypothetical protein A2V49_03820 [candidate division WWE3 bacterium RBG_19FT_COMBO_34_6]
MANKKGVCMMVNNKTDEEKKRSEDLSRTLVTFVSFMGWWLLIRRLIYHLGVAIGEGQAKKNDKK